MESLRHEVEAKFPLEESLGHVLADLEKIDSGVTKPVTRKRSAGAR